MAPLRSKTRRRSRPRVGRGARAGGRGAGWGRTGTRPSPSSSPRCRHVRTCAECRPRSASTSAALARVCTPRLDQPLRVSAATRPIGVGTWRRSCGVGTRRRSCGVVARHRSCGVVARHVSGPWRPRQPTPNRRALPAIAMAAPHAVARWLHASRGRVLGAAQGDRGQAVRQPFRPGWAVGPQTATRRRYGRGPWARAGSARLSARPRSARQRAQTGSRQARRRTAWQRAPLLFLVSRPAVGPPETAADCGLSVR
jgi:hypothetical protein